MAGLAEIPMPAVSNPCGDKPGKDYVLFQEQLAFGNLIWIVKSMITLTFVSYQYISYAASWGEEFSEYKWGEEFSEYEYRKK